MILYLIFTYDLLKDVTKTTTYIEKKMSRIVAKMVTEWTDLPKLQIRKCSCNMRVSAEYFLN